LVSEYTAIGDDRGDRRKMMGAAGLTDEHDCKSSTGAGYLEGIMVYVDEVKVLVADSQGQLEISDEELASSRRKRDLSLIYSNAS
jgi:hypothetical protein